MSHSRINSSSSSELSSSTHLKIFLSEESEAEFSNSSDSDNETIPPAKIKRAYSDSKLYRPIRDLDVDCASEYGYEECPPDSDIEGEYSSITSSQKSASGETSCDDGETIKSTKEVESSASGSSEADVTSNEDNIAASDFIDITHCDKFNKLKKIFKERPELKTKQDKQGNNFLHYLVAKLEVPNYQSLFIFAAKHNVNLLVAKNDHQRTPLQLLAALYHGVSESDIVFKILWTKKDKIYGIKNYFGPFLQHYPIYFFRFLLHKSRDIENTDRLDWVKACIDEFLACDQYQQSHSHLKKVKYLVQIREIFAKRRCEIKKVLFIRLLEELVTVSMDEFYSSLHAMVTNEVDAILNADSQDSTISDKSATDAAIDEFLYNKLQVLFKEFTQERLTRSVAKLNIKKNGLIFFDSDGSSEISLGCASNLTTSSNESSFFFKGKLSHVRHPMPLSSSSSSRDEQAVVSLNGF